MADYQPIEIVDMILVLGESQNNYRAMARLYAECYPDRRHPDDGVIRRLTQRARGGHMFHQRRRHVYNENVNRVVAILAVIHLDPQIIALVEWKGKLVFEEVHF